MLPKNSLRGLWLKNIICYEEGGHDLHHLGLPQFGHVPAVDYHKILQGNLSPETHQIVDMNIDKKDCKQNNTSNYIIQILLYKYS